MYGEGFRMTEDMLPGYYYLFRYSTCLAYPDKDDPGIVYAFFFDVRHNKQFKSVFECRRADGKFELGPQIRRNNSIEWDLIDVIQGYFLK